MKKISVLAFAGVTGVLTAATISTTALAWHPKGVITKSVMNQTTGGALSDANNAGSAVNAKPGDILKYVIEVRNDGSAGKANEMHFTKLTDKLPSGVELVSDPSKREITEDLGVIKPGEKTTKEYLVKVTSAKDGDLIENEACFTGDSEVKDNPQKGCDIADVKVSAPKEDPKPEPAPPAAAPTPQAPAAKTAEALPATGASSLFAPVAAVASGAVAYAGRLVHLKRRQK
ncbi:MAG TPA: hypothetical protein VFT16_01390 [Candidatus Saccharimonadales bacterium]|nr:hypothetical protein [Candidatus Saccharimonadales bacterium]